MDKLDASTAFAGMEQLLFFRPFATANSAGIRFINAFPLRFHVFAIAVISVDRQEWGRIRVLAVISSQVHGRYDNVSRSKFRLKT
jgi:hypothetical protein